LYVFVFLSIVFVDKFWWLVGDGWWFGGWFPGWQVLTVGAL